MARDLFEQRKFRAVTEPTRFGQVIETAKNALVWELRRFLDQGEGITERLTEIPTLEKYQFGFDQGLDPYETVVQILRKNPEVLEALPHIAVLAVGGQWKPLSVGTPQLATVQDAPRIVTSDGPWDFSADPAATPLDFPADRDTISVRTFEGTQDIILRTTDFATLSAVTPAELARAINARAKHVTAVVKSSAVEIRCKRPTPNSVEIVPSRPATAELTGIGPIVPPTALSLITASTPRTIAEPVVGTITVDGNGTMTLTRGGTDTFPVGVADPGKTITVTGSPYLPNNGRYVILTRTDTAVTFAHPGGQAASADWSIGLQDDWKNVARPPKHRYAMAWDLTLELQTLTEDENTRQELSDLIISFLTFYMEQQHFTLLGRSVTDESVTGEHWQIVLLPNIRAGSEVEVARTDDGIDKIYTARFDVSLNISMYIDREVEHPDNPGVPWYITPSDLTG